MYKVDGDRNHTPITELLRTHGHAVVDSVLAYDEDHRDKIEFRLRRVRGMNESSGKILLNYPSDLTKKTRRETG